MSRCRDFYRESLSPSERVVAEPLSAGHLYRCRECDLAFREPVPTADELDFLYRQLPCNRWRYDPASMVSWARSAALLNREFVGRENVVVLDVGCFDGGFLKLLPPAWERVAIEPCEQARSKLAVDGVTVIARYLNNPVVERRGTCDAVCLFDVFEHLLNPTEGLLTAVAYLKPGGLLLVSTGNSDHWSWRFLKGDHWYLDPVQHVRFGSRRYFRRFADRHGCRLLRLETISHQRATWTQRLHEALITLCFGLRKRSYPERAIARIIGCLPGFRELRHKAAPPYTQKLSDHLLAVFQKADAKCE